MAIVTWYTNFCYFLGSLIVKHHSSAGLAPCSFRVMAVVTVRRTFIEFTDAHDVGEVLDTDLRPSTCPPRFVTSDADSSSAVRTASDIPIIALGMLDYANEDVIDGTSGVASPYESGAFHVDSDSMPAVFGGVVYLNHPQPTWPLLCNNFTSDGGQARRGDGDAMGRPGLFPLPLGVGGFASIGSTKHYQKRCRP